MLLLRTYNARTSIKRNGRRFPFLSENEHSSFSGNEETQRKECNALRRSCREQSDWSILAASRLVDASKSVYRIVCSSLRRLSFSLSLCDYILVCDWCFLYWQPPISLFVSQTLFFYVFCSSLCETSLCRCCNAKPALCFQPLKLNSSLRLYSLWPFSLLSCTPVRISRCALYCLLFHYWFHMCIIICFCYYSYCSIIILFTTTGCQSTDDATC